MSIFQDDTNESILLREELLLVSVEAKLENVKSKCRRKLENFILEWINKANTVITITSKGQDIMELWKNENYLSAELNSLSQKQEYINKRQLLQRLENTITKLNLTTDLYKDIDLQSIKDNIKNILDSDKQMDMESLEKLIKNTDGLRQIKSDVFTISQINQKCATQIQNILMQTLIFWSKEFKENN